MKKNRVSDSNFIVLSDRFCLSIIRIASKIPPYTPHPTPYTPIVIIRLSPVK
ncbi:MAG: hypothetical protein F6J93_13880 [Oscillatoria sp. SIO1A7]|nr:hypothetical protein [Oscillatoria sp. SIO1A7]